jgi:hypothetical protein
MNFSRLLRLYWTSNCLLFPRKSLFLASKQSCSDVVHVGHWSTSTTTRVVWTGSEHDINWGLLPSTPYCYFVWTWSEWHLDRGLLARVLTRWSPVSFGRNSAWILFLFKKIISSKFLTFQNSFLTTYNLNQPSMCVKNTNFYVIKPLLWEKS